MKYLILAAALLASSAFARDVYVQPHVNRDGTYVQGHYRTAPDSTPFNNYSTQGNVNPYTGQSGTVNPYTLPQPSYGQQQRCHKDMYGNVSCY
jgi:hypothetical protein